MIAQGQSITFFNGGEAVVEGETRPFVSDAETAAFLNGKWVDAVSDGLAGSVALQEPSVAFLEGSDTADVYRAFGASGRLSLYVPSDQGENSRFGNSTCWQVTQGTGSEGPSRREDGAPPCHDYLLQTYQIYDPTTGDPLMGSQIKIEKWSVGDLSDFLDSTLPVDWEAGRFPGEDRQLDWVNFSDDPIPWCDAQKDLIYATLGLLNMPDVIDMAELAVCMFVAKAGWKEVDQVTEHSRVMSQYRELIRAREDAHILQGVNSLTGAVAFTDLWFPNPSLVVKKAKAPKVKPEDNEEEVQLAISELPRIITFASEGPKSALAKATTLFASGATGTVVGPTARTRVCAVISMARLLFHELLHLACVDTVPEIAGKKAPCGDQSAHPNNGLYTCNIVDLASEMFSFFLDQLVENAAWSKAPGCDILVPEQSLGTRTDLASQYVGHAFPSDKDPNGPNVSDPCLDTFFREADSPFGPGPPTSERAPEYREPDLGDVDDERLPGLLWDAEWEADHGELEEGLLG